MNTTRKIFNFLIHGEVTPLMRTYGLLLYVVGVPAGVCVGYYGALWGYF